MDGSGLFGTGIFGPDVNPLDFSTWGWPEVAVVALGFFALALMFSTTKHSVQRTARGARTVGRGIKRVGSATGRIARAVTETGEYAPTYRKPQARLT